MRLIIDFSNEFLDKVQAKINETWDGMPPEYTVPDLATVVLNAFDSLAEWAAEDSAEMARCQKVDSCQAEAMVLQEIAALFRGIIL
jgi:hypothetical protein